MDGIVCYFNYWGGWGCQRKVAGVRRFAQTRGWRVATFSPKESRPDAVAAFLARLHPLGCIVGATVIDTPLPPSLFGDTPTVWLDAHDKMLWPGFPIVACDNASVARCAFRELSSTRPPCCAAVSSAGLERWSDERVAVFRGLCGEAGIRCAVFRSLKGENAAARADRLERWVSSLPLRTAVFAVNDMTSAEVRAAARKALRHIPRQMVLLGVDDLADVKEGSDIDVDPDALVGGSSIMLDMEGAGFVAARLLAAKMADRAAQVSARSTPRPFGPPPSRRGDAHGKCPLREGAVGEADWGSPANAAGQVRCRVGCRDLRPPLRQAARIDARERPARVRHHGGARNHPPRGL